MQLKGSQEPLRAPRRKTTAVLLSMIHDPLLSACPVTLHRTGCMLWLVPCSKGSLPDLHFKCFRLPVLLNCWHCHWTLLVAEGPSLKAFIVQLRLAVCQLSEACSWSPFVRKGGSLDFFSCSAGCLYLGYSADGFPQSIIVPSVVETPAWTCLLTPTQAAKFYNPFARSAGFDGGYYGKCGVAK